ncbi:MAG TPA: DUF4238 domain-containing protein [Thermoanaerobaculia bacterium]|nr:DUF4238 domain-containing protein [Thermoanaerobaculia bacterium]
MQPARETEARLHHLISQGYMLRFSPDGKRVHIFDQITGKFRFSKPKNVAAQIDFYTMKTKDGESKRWIESRLAEVDAAVGIFDKLERGEEITREERFRVAAFAGFADSRGSGFRSATPPLSARHNPEDDAEFLPHFAEALSAMTDVHLEPWVVKNIVLDDVAHLAEGFDENSVMIAHGMELSMQLFWSQWFVAVAMEGATFITSDRPIGLITRAGASGDDAYDATTFRLLPLSPRAALFIGRPSEDPSIEHLTFNSVGVRGANIAVARRADRNLIASSEEALRAILPVLKAGAASAL